MFTLEKEFKFEAAHRLPHHDGKCQRLHGHSWKGHLILRGAQLHLGGPKVGMLTDYADISKVIKPVVEDYLDHHYLNETVCANPTSEEVARWVYARVKPHLPELVAVVIEETCTSACRYEPQG